MNTPECKPPTDYALGGKILWANLANQLAQVWWKASEIGATLQHGPLENETTAFSIVLSAEYSGHGTQCFHGDTPMDAWQKAYKWLVSPSRFPQNSTPTFDHRTC